MTLVGHSIALNGERGAGGIDGGRRGADGDGSLATAAPPRVPCSVALPSSADDAPSPALFNPR